MAYQFGCGSKSGPNLTIGSKVESRCYVPDQMSGSDLELFIRVTFDMGTRSVSQIGYRGWLSVWKYISERYFVHCSQI